MGRVGVLVGAVFALVAFASSAAARSPRLERLSPTPADTRLAKAALLRKDDLSNVAPGWLPLSTIPDNSAPVCPWQDYSRFTLTGRGEADFQPTKVGRAGFIGSSVDIYSTSSDALGKFTVDIHPGTAACEAEALRKALGPNLKTTSSRRFTITSVGDRAVGYEFVYEQPKGTPKRIYIHILEFARGRGVAVLDTTDFDAPGSTATRLALARLIDARLE